jgi:hypothetical protein
MNPPFPVRNFKADAAEGYIKIRKIKIICPKKNPLFFKLIPSRGLLLSAAINELVFLSNFFSRLPAFPKERPGELGLMVKTSTRKK